MDSKALIAHLRLIGGQIYRHDREGNEELICSATRLKNGYWLTVADRGIYGGRVYNETQGTMVLVDLWLHPNDGRAPMPIKTAHMTAMKPVAILFVPGDAMVGNAGDGIIGSTALTHQRDYVKIYRDGGSEVYESSIYDRPWPQRYDVERDNAISIVGRCDMGYRMGRHNYGAPMVNEDGRIVGIIVGSDWGTDSSHAGFYVPADMLLVCLELYGVLEQRQSNGESVWRVGIEHVSHRSHDVYFD